MLLAIYFCGCDNLDLQQISSWNYSGRYGIDVVKCLHKFEKLDFKNWKYEADLKFLQMCHLHGLTDQFLNLKLANNSLKHLRTYNNVTQCYWKKRSRQKVISYRNKKKCNFKNGTEKTVSLYDFAHLAFLLVVTVNWQRINKVSYKKLHSLGKDISVETNDPDKVTVYYFSSQVIKCWRE